MNIAVDAYSLTFRTSSGIPNYTRNILAGLLRIDADNRYVLYSKSRPEFSSAPNLIIRGGLSESSASFENTLWLFTKGVMMMKKDAIDLFWGARQMLPPYLPRGVSKILTVYDILWHYYPETMDRYNLMVLKALAKRSIKAADHIIAISEATARSIKEVLGVPEEKISVAYPAADLYRPMDKNESARYISGKYGTKMNYVLTVSTVEPRKNLTSLLRAFAELKEYQLLVAGASGWKTSSLHEEYNRLGLTDKEVKFLGYVPDEDMNRLYSGAALFVFPSVYEGFGIPALEAMASGIPVISSNASSLPEVAGDAGILLDPNDLVGWKREIAKVLSDEGLRAAMSEKGLKRAKAFSWERSARETLKVFQRYG